MSAALLRHGAVLLLLLGTTATLAAQDGAAPIREALQDGAPAWYDPDRDSWQRLELPEPTASSSASPTSGTSDGIGMPDLGGLLVGLLVVAAVAALALIVITFLRWHQAEAPETRSTARPLPRAAPDLSALPVAADEPDLDDPERRLARALAEDDPEQVAIWLYICVLLHLDRQGLVRLQRGRTNGAYLRELGDAPAPLRELFRAVASSFETAYFGALPLAADRLQELVAAWRGTVQASARRSR